MEVLVAGWEDVERALPMERCIAVMERTLRQVSRGEAEMPLRTVMAPGGVPGAIGLMPAHLPGEGALGVKVISVFPENRARGLESHQGFVVLFDPGDGRPLALVDASAVTAIRTAAVSAVATRALARPDSCVLALLGSGTQARMHLEAMRRVLPVREVRVWSRTPANARAFAEAEGARSGLPVRAVASVAEAVRDADVVCTVTASRDPILPGRLLAPGQHVNAVGASRPPARELDSEAVAMARFYVDSRASAFAESSDLLVPMREGRVGEDHVIGEIGEVLLGRAPGRAELPAEGPEAREPVTVFKSLGLAAEDVAAALDVVRAMGGPADAAV